MPISPHSKNGHFSEKTRTLAKKHTFLNYIAKFPSQAF